MTDFGYGGEMGSVVPSSGGVFESAAGGYNTSRGRCGMGIAYGGYAQSITFTGQASIWLHWCAYFGSSTTAADIPHLTLLAGSTEVARVRFNEKDNGAYTARLDYWTGSAWVAVTGSVDLGVLTVNTLDLYFNKTTGDFELYSSGTLVIDGAGLPLSGLGSITGCRYLPTHFVGGVASELVWSTDSTVGAAVFHRWPSADGANTAWTGTYEDVDELAYSDAEGISSSVANDKETFVHTGATLTGYLIRGVSVNIRAKKGSSGPTQIKGVLRISGTDYPHATAQALGVGFGAHCFVWTVSPATGIAFTAAEAAAMEFGVQAIA